MCNSDACEHQERTTPMGAATRYATEYQKLPYRTCKLKPGNLSSNVFNVLVGSLSQCWHQKAQLSASHRPVCGASQSSRFMASAQVRRHGQSSHGSLCGSPQGTASHSSRSRAVLSGCDRHCRQALCSRGHMVPGLPAGPDSVHMPLSA